MASKDSLETGWAGVSEEVWEEALEEVWEEVADLVKGATLALFFQD